MKLLCVVPSYWPAFQFGGPIFSVHGLNKALVKKGIDVTVYTTNIGLDGKIAVNQEVNIDGIKVNYFEVDRPYFYCYSLPLLKTIKREIKNYDLIHIHSVYLFPTLIAAHYARKFKVPYIITPRGLLAKDAIEFKSRIKKKAYIRFIENKNVKNAELLHFTTEGEKNKTLAAGLQFKDSVVIPNGVDLKDIVQISHLESIRGKYPELKDKVFLLFLGRIDKKKGLDLLICSYEELIKKRSDIHLIIAGPESNYEKNIKLWIKEKKLEKHITFTGFVLDDEKAKLFLESDIFVLPSYYESFGISVIEAMYYGLPVVITDRVEIYDEVKKYNAGIIIKTNSDELLNSLSILVENARLRKTLGEQGKALVREKYLWNNVVDEMIDTYKNIGLCT